MYLGNLDWSKQRWNAEGKKTKAAGFPSVTKSFQKQFYKGNSMRTAGISAEVSTF
jgi:hypothetical protein